MCMSCACTSAPPALVAESDILANMTNEYDRMFKRQYDLTHHHHFCDCQLSSPAVLSDSYPVQIPGPY